MLNGIFARISTLLRNPGWLALAAALVFATGCSDDPAQSPIPNPCPEGTQGCACALDGCNEGLVCDDSLGLCRETCELGTEDCGCTVDGCQGELVCQGDVCAQADCGSGEEGCPCEDGGCAADLFCVDGTCQGAEDCTPGNEGCVCGPDDACAEGLLCDGGTCIDPDCPPGLEGCACLDDECGLSDLGQALECSGGLCQQLACPSGDTGCACIDGVTCNNTGDSCVGGFCTMDTCIPGAEGCECLAGGCNPGLTCRGGAVCVDNTGQEGGPCRSNNTCDRNARCDTAGGDPLCVFCNLGTQGCQCRDDETCGPGLTCQSGLCIGDETVHNRRPPADPRCYTPCNDDLLVGDEVRRCDSEGLMEGCLVGQSCVEGSCVFEGEEPSECFADSNCAQHQLCVQGRCYSECKTSIDCDPGLTCFLKACRLPCSLDQTSCPPGQTCEAPDAQNGFCMVTAESDEEEQEIVDGNFEVSELQLEFSNVRLERFFTIQNNSDEFVTFTIRKTEHRALLSDGSTDSKRRTDPEEDCIGADCPLFWVEMGEFGAITQEVEIEVRAEPNCGDECPVIFVRLPDGGLDARRWRGELKIESTLGSAQLDLSYVQTPEGRWSGGMFYFANFSDEGIQTVGNIEGWVDRNNRDDVSGVRNGLIERWGAFRNGNLTGGFGEFIAALRATESGQWRFPSVQRDCIAQSGACYLFDAGQGALPKVYVTSVSDSPIPTGVTELPMEMNLYVPDGVGEPEILSGKVVSDSSLHYAGDPAIDLTFAANPADARNCDPDVRSNCVVFIEDMNINLSVGGRYMPDRDESGCDLEGFERQSVPWLVPGFLGDATLDPETGLYNFDTCVDARLPNFGAEDRPSQITNLNLAASNPIPDGAVRERTLELLDGAMIDQSQILIFFRERYPSFLGDGDDLGAYGYILLSRIPTEIDRNDADNDGVPDGYQGSRPPEGLDEGESRLGVECSEDLIDEILGEPLTESNAPRLITALLNGGQPPSRFELDPTGFEEVHYLCVDTGLFDGGPENTARWDQGAIGPNDNSCGSVNNICEDGLSGADNGDCAAGTDALDCGFRYTDTRAECPLTSEVIFFSVDRRTQPNVFSLPCQQNGTCLNQLNAWIEGGTALLTQVQPTYRCTDDNAVFCDNNRLDLRDGKTFFAATSEESFDLPLRVAMEDAFRYRTRFRSDTGRTLGFTPRICEPFSNNTPYCYDPFRIEELRGKVDCLLDVYQRFYASQEGSALPGADDLYGFLSESFSFLEVPSPLGGPPDRYDGFERLYSELLIMLGDDAFTSSFESRFDLAGSRTAGFEGERFEKDGINLSGIAGFEMVKLYQSVQYFQMVLEHFYFISPVINASLEAGPTQANRNFVSAEMVTSYFDRLARASTQKARAQAEIARRYQNFNRPDLARRVAERAYTSAYLESVALSNLIQRIYDIAGGSDRPQILAGLEDTQRRYRVAMLDLSDVYESITDEINFFGFPADFIPFPALDTGGGIDRNGFDAVQVVVQAKMDVARQREQTALANTRGFETDAAQFQSELTRITRTFESQLAEICGTFEGPDQVIYPAIERYADLDPSLAQLGDPCGFVGNGAIHQAVGRIDQVRIAQQRTIVQTQNVFAQVEIERQRVSDYCGEIVELADFQYDIGEQRANLALQALQTEQGLEQAQRTAQFAMDLAGGAVCDSTAGCIAAGIAAIAKTGAFVVQELFVADANEKAVENQTARTEIDLDSARWQTEQQCDMAELDSNATTANLLLQLNELDINHLENDYQMRLAFSEVQRLRHQAKRIQLEQRESIQLTLNVEAARNDPNVRIYRNDSVINADFAFQDVLREAYRLTLIYQYYTSQSYARLDELFLVRMVSVGEHNLENYVLELQNAFAEFEEEFGNPDVRVEVLSMRDDMLRIPRLDENGQALSVDARARRMRDLLRNPALLDKNGYLTVPFRTQIEDLSPLTRNHKILYIEANIEGNDNGDFLGRLYLRQTGTGVIRTLNNEFDYFRLPQRTAVINPFFNSTREFANAPEVYRNFRLRDRPLVNTSWELVINQRDEAVNQDINLGALTDIKIYVFYTDFTAF